MINNMQETIDRLVKGIQTSTDRAILGLSGGADSTLVCILCVKALGANNVHTLHMPYDNHDISDGRFNMRSLLLASQLKVKSELVWIGEASKALESQFKNDLENIELSILNRGNMRSRMRMIGLYTHNCVVSEANPDDRCRVMGTGNMSEDFIGYDTKGGDALADLFPIGDLYKSEVYQMLDYFVEQGVITEEHIDRTPSAGLWIGQTDEDELGYTYNQMEPYIRHYLQTGEWNTSSIVGKIVKERHYANKHKHMAPPTIELRSYLDKDCLDE